MSKKSAKSFANHASSSEAPITETTPKFVRLKKRSHHALIIFGVCVIALACMNVARRVLDIGFTSCKSIMVEKKIDKNTGSMKAVVYYNKKFYILVDADLALKGKVKDTVITYLKDGQMYYNREKVLDGTPLNTVRGVGIAVVGCSVLWLVFAYKTFHKLEVQLPGYVERTRTKRILNMGKKTSR